MTTKKEIKMKKGDNIRLRKDGRYEARYIKSRDNNGNIHYGYCYGRTYEEAKEKREYQLQKLSKKEKRELNLLVLGAGAQGLEIYDIAKNLRIFTKIDFLDDNPYVKNVIGSWNDVEDYIEDYPVAIVAVADEFTRYRWMKKLQRLGFIIPMLIHPTAYVPEGTDIGGGSVICARTTIATGVKIGEGCIITSGSTVPKKTVIPDWGYFDFDRCITGYHEKYNIPSLGQHIKKGKDGLEQ